MNIYGYRMNGYALITFFLGMLANYLFGEKVLIVAIPVFLMWMFTYDIKSHERGEKRVDSSRN